MSVSYIFYRDIAPGADEDAVFTVTEAGEDSTITNLAEENTPPPIATMEPNRWLLNGSFQLPHQPVPYWSNRLSGDDCKLEPAPVIDIQFDRQYSSVGSTLVFDQATGEYCRKVNIQWYQGENLKSDMDFFPNSASYLCENTVTSWDRLVITLLETSLPRRLARMNQVIFGLYRRFGMTELREVKLVNQCDLAALTLPVSTLDWELDSRSDIQFMFQFKQPVEVWNDEHMVGVYYIDGHSRKAMYLRSINCYDALGVLDEVPFPGGVYTSYSAKKLLEDIIGGDFELDIEVEDTNLTGAILPGTKRSAIQQVLFAWGAVASTDGRYTIRVFHPPEEGQAVGSGRTYMGASVDTASIITAVQMTSHSYTASSNGNVEINGQKYADTTQVFTVTNPDVTSNDKENVVSVANATLISPAIAQATAQRLYDFYTRRNTVKAKIVWKGERLGDRTTLPTPWEEEISGNIQKMNITLSNTVATDIEALG